MLGRKTPLQVTAGGTVARFAVESAGAASATGNPKRRAVTESACIGLPSGGRTTPLSSRGGSVSVESRKGYMPPRSAAAAGYSSWPLQNGYAGVTSNQRPLFSETMMRFYNQQHRFYCGVDLHARTLSLCVLDDQGAKRLERTIDAAPDAFLQAVAPYRDGLAVACERMFAWYWLADCCAAEAIPFVLGHALYMKAIHGGKAKTDTIDAHKVAVLLRGGMLPQAYVYPRGMRETRDLLRRRTFF